MKRKMVYEVCMSKEGEGYYVYIPDFDMSTEGKDLADAIFMARDAIGIMGIQIMDEGKELPTPFSNREDNKKETYDIETLVDIDFDEYRKKHDNRMVKKNCTIPYYLSRAAEEEGINFSRVLQDALKEKLQID